MSSRKINTLLVDMDNVLVNMVEKWINVYNQDEGTNHKFNELNNYDVGTLCKNNRLLYDILDRDGFFFDLEPMPGAVENFQKLLNDGYDLVVVTQPPRRADMAIHDKRRWMKKHFNDYDHSHMIFCHRKDMVRGDLLFDDKPDHLIHWKKINPDNMIATLDWRYNKDIPTHFRGSLENGWEEFYQFVKKVNGEKL